MPDFAPISVVIPSYNAELLSRESVETVRAQSVPVSEIILVDDGSCDQAEGIASQMGARIVQHSQGGVSAARNAGIRAAAQPWIAFLDAGDAWEPEKIEYQWAAIERHPSIGMVSCDFCVVQQVPSALTAPNPRCESACGVNASNISYFPHPDLEFLADRMNYYTSTAVIRRDALLSVGLFDENLEHNGDFDCFQRILARWPLAMVEEPLVRHQDKTRECSRHPLEMALSYADVVDRMQAHPERYPPGAAEAYKGSSLQALHAAGRSLLREGRRREARRLFARSLQKSMQARAFLLWAATWLRPEVFASLTTLKRRSVVFLGRLGLASSQAPQPELGHDEGKVAVARSTPQEIVDRMLQAAGVKKDEMVYDLGSCDGRILISAAQRFGARATGVELDRTLFRTSQERIRQLKLEDRVRIIHGNLLQVDLSTADVVTLYLHTDSNARLRPNLEKYLRPGSRVVSHDFHIIGWRPTRVERVKHSSRTHTIYLYEIGPKQRSRDGTAQNGKPV